MESSPSKAAVFILLILASSNLVSSLSNHPKVIVVAFHGFGNYYIQNTTYLKGLKEKSTSASSYLKPQYITESLPNLQTIATGLFIESHGITGNEFYDTVAKQTLVDSDPKFWEYSDQVVPLWTINQQKLGRHSGVMSWPGGNVSYQGKLPTYLEMNPTTLSDEERIDTVLQWLNNETAPANLIFIYFDIPGVDAKIYGPNSNEAFISIQKADNITGYLLQQLTDQNILDQVNLIFLSDHGIAPIHPDGAIDIQKLLRSSQSQVHGNGAFLQIQPPEGKMDQVYSDLKFENSSANYNVIQVADLDKSVPGARKHSKTRLAPLMLMARLGYFFKDQGPALKGSGGYNNSFKEMNAFFLGIGPAFKSRSIAEAIDNIQVFPLISNILGISTANGSLENIESFLQPTASIEGTGTVTVIIIIGAMLLIGGGIALYLDRLQKRFYPIDQS